MASGMPSSRRHSPVTSARFASETAKPGTAAAARCANSSTASPPPASPGPGTGSGGSGKTCSPGTSSGCRLLASTVTPGACPQQRADQRRAPRDYVLARVEDEQQAAAAQVVDHGVRPRAGVLLRQPEARRDRVRNQVEVAQPAKLGEADAVGEPPRRPGRRRAARPASSRRRPRPVTVTSLPPQQPGQRVQLTVAADEAGHLAGQLTGYRCTDPRVIMPSAWPQVSGQGTTRSNSGHKPRITRHLPGRGFPAPVGTRLVIAEPSACLAWRCAVLPDSGSAPGSVPLPAATCTCAAVGQARMLLPTNATPQPLAPDEAVPGNGAVASAGNREVTAVPPERRAASARTAVRGAGTAPWRLGPRSDWTGQRRAPAEFQRLHPAAPHRAEVPHRRSPVPAAIPPPWTMPGSTRSVPSKKRATCPRFRLVNCCWLMRPVTP